MGGHESPPPPLKPMGIIGWYNLHLEDIPLDPKIRVVDKEAFPSLKHKKKFIRIMKVYM